MSILILFQLCSIFSVAIYLWFNTDFFPSYIKLFRKIVPIKLYYWLMIDEYFSRSGDDLIYSSYIEYLYSKKIIKDYKIEFLIKLFSCPLCISTWCSILVSILTMDIMNFGTSFLIIRGVDFLLNFFIKK